MPGHRPLEAGSLSGGWISHHPEFPLWLVEGNGPSEDASPHLPDILAAEGAGDVSLHHRLCGDQWASTESLLASFLAPKVEERTDIRPLSKWGNHVVFYKLVGSEGWSLLCFAFPVTAQKTLSLNNWIIGRFKMRAWCHSWVAPCFEGFSLTHQVKWQGWCVRNWLPFSEAHRGPNKPRYFSDCYATSITYKTNDHCVEVKKFMPTNESYFLPKSVLDKHVLSIFVLPEEEWTSSLLNSKSGIIYLKCQLFKLFMIKHDKGRENLNFLLLFKTDRVYIIKENYRKWSNQKI